MKKWIFSTVLMFSLSAVAFELPRGTYHSGHRTQSFSEILEDHLSVKLMQVSGFNQEGLKKIQSAFQLLEKVVNSEEFKNRIINFINTKGERQFASNKGLSNEEIYNIFMEGREILQQDTPHEMNFFLNLYNNPWSKVIGYTDPGTKLIHINWKFFKNYKPNEVAGNLAHEWTHQIGFDHKSAAEHDSAPYAIGYIVEELGAEFLKREVP